MGSGKQRLEDMHKGKRKATVKIIEKGINNSQDETQPAKCRIKQFRASKKDPQPLSEDEQELFDDILKRLQGIHPDPEKYILSAKNLARIMAMQKRLKDRVEMDGGEILESSNGKLYAHPAVNIMQKNYSMIITNLKAMGIVSPRAINKNVKEGDESTFVSEFAQF